MRFSTRTVIRNAFSRGSLVADYRIACFLEDIMQEQFIRAMVVRIAEETGVHPRALDITTRNGSGGLSAAVGALERYLQDIARGLEDRPDILVVAMDGDCDGPDDRRRQIEEILADLGEPPCVVIATPDPYVERWYVVDATAIKEALGKGPAAVATPPRCSHDVFKDLLRDTIAKADATPALGGYEYADLIVPQIDLYRAGRAEPAFGHFVTDLRACMKAP